MTAIGETRHPGFYAGILWRDENIDILSATVPGNNSLPTPLIRPLTGIPYASFPSGSLAEVPMHKEYNHDALIYPRSGVIPQIRPHVHFAPTTADAGNIKWFFEYFIHANGTFISGTLSVLVAAGGVAWEEQRIEIGVIEFPVGLHGKTGPQISGLLYRDPTGDIEDTYPAPVVIVDTAGWHYPVDSAGSIGVFSKYG